MYRILLSLLAALACLLLGARLNAADDEGKQVTEGIVDAPIGVVWEALATKKGLESWNVAHAEVELRVGGKMRTHYDPKGKLGDPRTIVNSILSFEPRRMLSIKATGLPQGFPYAKAMESVWTTIYFEEAGPGRTHVRLVGQGYGSDEESKKLRAFFAKGNAYTLQKLQKHFAAKGDKNPGAR
jgi:uncharacterized protein YndB with AHSA1/START domain